jgi:hypothetical protein
MTEPTLQDIIAQGESLTVEFKSDRGPLDDSELLDTDNQGAARCIPTNCPAGGPTGARPTSRPSPSLRPPGTTLTH